LLTVEFAYCCGLHRGSQSDRSLSGAFSGSGLREQQYSRGVVILPNKIMLDSPLNVIIVLYLLLVTPEIALLPSSPAAGSPGKDRVGYGYINLRTEKQPTKDIIASPAPVWSEVGDRKEVAAPSYVLKTRFLEQSGTGNAGILQASPIIVSPKYLHDECFLNVSSHLRLDGIFHNDVVRTCIHETAATASTEAIE
jgi:hypothetical protein